MNEGILMPETSEIIRAADIIIKLDLAILKAEMDAGIFERKIGTVDLNVYRAAPLEPETAAKISEVFQRWGIDLTLPERSSEARRYAD